MTRNSFFYEASEWVNGDIFRVYIVCEQSINKLLLIEYPRCLFCFALECQGTGIICRNFSLFAQCFRCLLRWGVYCSNLVLNRVGVITETYKLNNWITYSSVLRSPIECKKKRFFACSWVMTLRIIQVYSIAVIMKTRSIANFKVI